MKIAIALGLALLGLLAFRRGVMPPLLRQGRGRRAP